MKYFNEKSPTIRQPFADCYWVEPGRLLAGEYPREFDTPGSRGKIRGLLALGITFFLDLTQPQEHGLKPYRALLYQEAKRINRKVEYCGRAILDLSTPSREVMSFILDDLDAALNRGKMVYLHCYGGIGRTGTVVGCYLVRHGMTGERALNKIARLRAGTPDGNRVSPETIAQRELVRGWDPGW